MLGGYTKSLTLWDIRQPFSPVDRQDKGMEKCCWWNNLHTKCPQILCIPVMIEIWINVRALCRLYLVWDSVAVAVVPHPPPLRHQCQCRLLPLSRRSTQLLCRQASAGYQQDGHFQPGTPLRESITKLRSWDKTTYRSYSQLFSVACILCVYQ